MLKIALVITLLLPAGGCVRRRLNVRTNPPGALVYVDNQQIGTTPCSVDFTYYGTREIRLIKPGFETLTVNQPIPTPWYEFPPLDFVSENLVATKIRDNRTVTYDLAPQVIVPTQQLVDRANQLRQDTLQYPVSPAGADWPAGVGLSAPMPAGSADSCTGPRTRCRRSHRRRRFRNGCRMSICRRSDNCRRRRGRCGRGLSVQLNRQRMAAASCCVAAAII